MGNRAERKRAGRAAAAMMTPVQPGTMAWGVKVSSTIWVSAHRGTPPSRWHRFWQRVLLGWTWEQRSL